MIAPPMELAVPFMYLLVEWTIMSAPSSPTRARYGVETVASTISGIPFSLAMAEKMARSGTSILGFPMVSTKMSRVFSLTAPRSASASVGSTNLVLMP